MKEVSEDLKEFIVTFMYEDVVLFRTGLLAVSKKDVHDILRKKFKFQIKEIEKDEKK